MRERPAGPDGGAAITVALVNTREVPAGWQKDPYSLFQAEFVVTSPEGDIFVDRTKVDVSGADEDADSFNLLYRHAPFAVGHGCGTTWTEATGGRASDVRTTFALSTSCCWLTITRISTRPTSRCGGWPR